MSLTKTVVSRPTTIIIIFALVIGFGIYAGLDLAIDLFPEINPPILVVSTSYEGAGPEEVERSVTRSLEGVLSNVGNIENIYSSSSEGSSFVQIEFTWGTDMSEAANDVRDKLEFVKGFLPEGAETPMIFKFDPSMIPILSLVVTGNRTAEELRDIAENFILPRLEQVDGVALTSISGGRERVIRVEIPQSRLEAYDLTMTQIANMLRGQNVQISAGSITEGDKNYLIQTAGEYRSIEEIKNTVITYKGAPPNPMDPYSSVKTIRLRDVANVYDGFKKESDAVFIDGEPGVYIQVQKQSGTNSVKTADNVIARLDKINQEIPLGIDVSVIDDTTKIIRNSLSQVGSSAFLGGLLAVIILLIFLRSLKSTIIIGFSIPVSLVVTFMLMYFWGLTLNIMTLAGLALGIGMLVDNSIVILENIYRYREKGAKLTASAILGSQEMIRAIMASTLTTICVFLPLTVFKDQLDMAGELFSGLSFTVVISLASSLLVAIFLIPVLASKYLPIRSTKQRPKKGLSRIIDNALGSVFAGLDNLYMRILNWVLKWRKTTIIIIFVIFLASLALIPFAGFQFIPAQQQDTVRITVELPIGTKLEVTKDLLKQLEIVAKREVTSYKHIILSAGERGFFGLGAGRTNRGSLTIVLPPFEERTENSMEIMQRFRKYFNSYPSAVFSFSGGNFSLGGSPIDVAVKSNDLDKAKGTAREIQALIEERIPEITEPSVNFKEGLPEIEIIIDRDKAYSLGLNIYTIGQEIKANIDGITASKYRSGGSENDILVILDQEDRDAVPDLNKIFVVNNMGIRVPLASFATLERTTGPITISRENQTRTVHVQGALAQGAKLNRVENTLRSMVSQEIPQDEDVIIEYTGDYQDLIKYGVRALIILVISIFLVFGVMASQFESFLDPFIIFFTIPLLLIGVIGIYVGTGEDFNIFTAVGLIMLVGIVVNNGIVLVDYTNLLRKRGRGIKEACIEAGGNRLRPILMTSLTTILALIPMAFFAGEGSEYVQPIGKTVVGGLAASTILTLILIPVLYSIFNEGAEKRQKRKEQKKAKRIERQRKLIEEGQV